LGDVAVAVVVFVRLHPGFNVDPLFDPVRGPGEAFPGRQSRRLGGDFIGGVGAAEEGVRVFDERRPREEPGAEHIAGVDRKALVELGERPGEPREVVRRSLAGDRAGVGTDLVGGLRLEGVGGAGQGTNPDRGFDDHPVVGDFIGADRGAEVAELPGAAAARADFFARQRHFTEALRFRCRARRRGDDSRRDDDGEEHGTRERMGTSHISIKHRGSNRNVETIRAASETQIACRSVTPSARTARSRPTSSPGRASIAP
jgi:hypothetical protein